MNLTDIYEIFYSNTIKYTLLSGLMGISLNYDMSKSHQIRRTEVTPHILYEYKPIPMVTEEKKSEIKIFPELNEDKDTEYLNCGKQ